jgi:hypothetical protein
MSKVSVSEASEQSERKTEVRFWSQSRSLDDGDSKNDPEIGRKTLE